MSKKGENIYKRKDGRWEGRYIRLYDENGKAKYGYVYGKNYSDVKQRLLEKRLIPAVKQIWLQNAQRYIVKFWMRGCNLQE